MSAVPCCVCCAGMSKTSMRRMTRLAEVATLVCCRLVPHAVMGAVVLINPAAFGSPLYYGMCLVGMAFTNWLNGHKALLLLRSGGSAGQQQLQGPAPAAGGSGKSHAE